MKRPIRTISAVVVAMIGTTLAFASPAYAATHDVYPGQSIQAAVNRASPGDTIVVHPGVYRQSVQIRKDGITLRGSGASLAGTVLRPPADAPKTPCAQFFEVPGICVLAKKVDTQTGRVITPVEGVTVKGFYAIGYRAFGVLTYGAKNAIIQSNRADDNGEYGLTSFASSGVDYLYNRATGSGEAGIYYGDSQSANSAIVGNIVWDNALGILIRDASHGRIAHNVAHDNCSGLLFIAGAPGPVKDWEVTSNESYHNTRFCPPEEAPFPISGNGIFMGGTNGLVLRDNTVWANQAPKPSPVAGGIVLSRGEGSFVPTDNVVKYNVMFRNKPYDLSYDKSGSGNRFIGNQCGTSRPGGLCN